MNTYDLSTAQRNLVFAMYDAAKAVFPEIETRFDIWLNPDDKEQILVNVSVPFYDNDREQEFSSFVAGLSCETHETSGVHIALVPVYTPEMEALEV